MGINAKVNNYDKGFSSSFESWNYIQESCPIADRVFRKALIEWGGIDHKGNEGHNIMAREYSVSHDDVRLRKIVGELHKMEGFYVVETRKVMDGLRSVVLGSMSKKSDILVSNCWD